MPGLVVIQINKNQFFPLVFIQINKMISLHSLLFSILKRFLCRSGKRKNSGMLQVLMLLFSRDLGVPVAHREKGIKQQIWKKIGKKRYLTGPSTDSTPCRAPGLSSSSTGKNGRSQSQRAVPVRILGISSAPSQDRTPPALICCFPVLLALQHAGISQKMLFPGCHGRE